MATSNRRQFFAQVGALGCSAAASPFVTPVTFAAAPGDARLVVIVLRGAMDGLDAVQPYGDPMLRKWRSQISVGPEGGALDLDGFFALHPALAPLMPLWTAGDLAFSHAVSTPYRGKRSHFDGQDLLENGGFNADGAMTDSEDGWLNRLVGQLGGGRPERAFSVGRENMLLLQGDAPHASWSPDVSLEMSEQGKLLLELIYQNDPLFAKAAKDAAVLSAKVDDVMSPNRAGRAGPLAKFAAERLAEETRIAAFSIGGWDTHRNQHVGIVRSLRELANAITALHDSLGPLWSKTAIVAMTEFGRTVAQNGSTGTDHGTGGAMVMAGGAINGGKVYGRWPGLAEADLYERRDLMPTDDVRRHAGWIMADLFGLDRASMDHVFPSVDFGTSPGLIL